ncbi:hypothetical protein FRB94_002955 [Tulasnella sp. JGI-2019a]|nr:hypothetical protein FRB93_005171 [Tulasnella sp. JGI-2019a]KAG9003741.1 hypothetical protein FRB94_002955 [Tulasnella sp. JGI-2019a]KAG9030993.1 hypothetical protein FRB95_003273 [Tulasnella sp. JGI-2019a]
MAPPAHAKPSVHPGTSVYATETFIFSVIVIIASLTVPLYMTGWISQKDEAVVKVVKVVSQATETLIAKSSILPTSAPTATQNFISATTVAAQAPTRTPAVPPYLHRLPNIFPYFSPILYTIFISLPKSVFLFIFNALYVPTAYTLSIVGKLLAPIWILLEVTFDLFILVPVKAIIWLFNLLYPVYVFVTVAAIVGALLGLVGAGIGKAGLRLVNPSGEQSTGDVGHMDARARAIKEREREWELEQERERNSKGKGRETGTIPTPTSMRSEARTNIKIEDDAPRRGRRVGFMDTS